MSSTNKPPDDDSKKPDDEKNEEGLTVSSRATQYDITDVKTQVVEDSKAERSPHAISTTSIFQLDNTRKESASVSRTNINDDKTQVLDDDIATAASSGRTILSPTSAFQFDDSRQPSRTTKAQKEPTSVSQTNTADDKDRGLDVDDTKAVSGHGTLSTTSIFQLDDTRKKSVSQTDITDKKTQSLDADWGGPILSTILVEQTVSTLVSQTNVSDVNKKGLDLDDSKAASSGRAVSTNTIFQGDDTRQPSRTVKAQITSASTSKTNLKDDSSQASDEVFAPVNIRRKMTVTSIFNKDDNLKKIDDMFNKDDDLKKIDDQATSLQLLSQTVKDETESTPVSQINLSVDKVQGSESDVDDAKASIHRKMTVTSLFNKYEDSRVIDNETMPLRQATQTLKEATESTPVSQINISDDKIQGSESDVDDAKANIHRKMTVTSIFYKDEGLKEIDNETMPLRQPSQILKEVTESTPASQINLGIDKIQGSESDVDDAKASIHRKMTVTSIFRGHEDSIKIDDQMMPERQPSQTAVVETESQANVIDQKTRSSDVEETDAASIRRTSTTTIYQLDDETPEFDDVIIPVKQPLAPVPQTKVIDDKTQASGADKTAAKIISKITTTASDSEESKEIDVQTVKRRRPTHGAGSQTETASVLSVQASGIYKAHGSSGFNSHNTSKYNLQRVLADDEEYYAPIHLFNIIFLPFNPAFQFFIFIVVLAKSILGPFKSVYPFVTCTSNPVHVWGFKFVTTFYRSIANVLYIIDIFLHIVHRQVVDEARKREHMPKSMFLLCIDIISVTPFWALAVSGQCPEPRFWPNILAFNELLVVYRVVQYFSLGQTHSNNRLIIGYAIFTFIVLNAVACLFLLLTFNGLCKICRTRLYDWRLLLRKRFPGILNNDEGHNAYIPSMAIAIMICAHNVIDYISPKTLMELQLMGAFAVFFFLFALKVYLPKMFGEIVFHSRRKVTFINEISRIVEETGVRNPDNTAGESVAKYYMMSWNKFQGLPTVPKSKVQSTIPGSMARDFEQDLYWSIFFHSPTLRNVSPMFKRWIAATITVEFKLPGERFFIGPHCYTNLYYVKSGIVQLISNDDSTSPVLSVTNGTIFGDINFFIPPLNRKVIVRCFTNCEIFVISRKSIIMANHYFANDRVDIVKRTNDRIRHARNIYAIKRRVKGVDRCEDEGFSWLKKQWWEMADALSRFSEEKKDLIKSKITIEEKHHCPKYIGQLVLCRPMKLKTKPMFAKPTFPWIIYPKSTFESVWHKIVTVFVILVVVFYPIILASSSPPSWFHFFDYSVNVVYMVDFTLRLMTVPEGKTDNVTSSSAVCASRCKRLDFFLDFAASPFIDYFISTFDEPHVVKIFKFNRLIKMHIFITRHANSELKTDTVIAIVSRVLMLKFCIIYVSCYFLYQLQFMIKDMSPNYYFTVCSREAGKRCIKPDQNVFDLFLGYLSGIITTYRSSRNDTLPKNYVDLIFGVGIVLAGYFLGIFFRVQLLAIFYLRYKSTVQYYRFVSKLKLHLTHYNIHPDLLGRLIKYLECHWKYYKGTEVTQPIDMSSEPFDIYYKYHGALAEKTIGHSKAFNEANSGLIKDLASEAKYMMLPSSTALYLFGSKCRNVTWVVHGTVRCEYPNERGELVKSYPKNDEMLVPCAVFLGKASLRTFITETDCEILSIEIRTFFNILERFSDDWTIIQATVKELDITFNRLFRTFVKKHKDYQRKLRTRVFHARKSILPDSEVQEEETEADRFRSQSTTPEAPAIIYWMKFRAVFVFISITAKAFQEACPPSKVKHWHFMDSLCNCITYCDIFFKMFMPYYNKQGLVITSHYKCAIHYLTRGFVVDVLGVMTWSETMLYYGFDAFVAHLVSRAQYYLHLYMLTGLWDYLAGVPTSRYVYYMMIKWLLILILICISVSSILSEYCFQFSRNMLMPDVVNITRTECWVPLYFNLTKVNTNDYISLVYSQATALTITALFGGDAQGYGLDKLDALAVYLFLSTLSWYVVAYSIALLLLQFRGDDVYQNCITRLIDFLKEERVDKEVVNRVGEHFAYWWDRTLGINICTLMTERMGIIFRQDFNYYFFKKTLASLDTILKGGEILQRHLSNHVTENYYMANEDVVREMHLAPFMHIVHRGSVVITRKGKQIAILRKGGIIGPLDSATIRPIRVTATTQERTDILQISAELFHNALSDRIRSTLRRNKNFKNDYRATPTAVFENPYNSIQYLLTPIKTIKIPKTKSPTDIRNNFFYFYFIYIVYLWVTAANIFCTCAILFVEESTRIATYVLVALDVIHVIYLVTELFTMHLILKDNDFQLRYMKWRLLLKPGSYLDILSFALPVFGLFTKQHSLHLFRLMKLHMFHKFHVNFASDSRNKRTPMVFKIVIWALIVHILTCMVVKYVCGVFDDRYIDDVRGTIKHHLNKTVDASEWVSPYIKLKGCKRMLRQFVDNKLVVMYAVPFHWIYDYIMALVYVISLHTHLNITILAPLTVSESYVKVFVVAVVNLCEIWIVSSVIGMIYRKFREQYNFDYEFQSILIYLKHQGLGVPLLQNILKYTQVLWQREQGIGIGSWTPAIVDRAPLCLREDMFSSLYIHHLKQSKVFRNVPLYFLNQLTVRLKRVVMLPGITIVHEGEIWPIHYFIHEGEVERWYTDMNGDLRIFDIIGQNQDFGMMAGVMDTPCYFTIIARTVTNLVYLKRGDWTDLLNYYPKVKKTIIANVEACSLKLENEVHELNLMFC